MASAHPFGARYDLPLPLRLYLTGAGAAVALSLVGAAVTMRPGAAHGRTIDLLARPVTRWLAHPVLLAMIRLLSVAIFLLIMLTAAIGDQHPLRNLAPTLIWVIWWVGFAFLLTYLLFSWLVAWAGGGVPFGTVARSFVLTLVPIAVAYHIAHYLSFLLLSAQLVIPLSSDPFGWGWDLFGTVNYRMDIGLIDAKTVRSVAVGSIVTGHVAAVYLAQVTALRLYPTCAAALKSQVPMLLLMVGHTMISLWILSQPVVETG